MTAFNELERNWHDTEAAYFKVLSHNSPGRTEKTYEKPQAGQSRVPAEFRTGHVSNTSYRFCYMIGFAPFTYFHLFLSYLRTVMSSIHFSSINVPYLIPTIPLFLLFMYLHLHSIFCNKTTDYYSVSKWTIV